MVEFIFGVGGIIILSFLVVMFFVSRFLFIVHPNEVMILSGRSRKLPDGTTVGYRIIRGGRAVRIPILEKAAKMSLETIPIELSVHNAYSKGGIPLGVEAIANVKIDSTEPVFGNAVERFLGKPLEGIHEIAKDTLEGNLRGVLAALTPEEINEDRLKFAHSLMEEADEDLKQLGLRLDTFKIQNISDQAGYLDSIGRRKTAEVIAAARKTEAENAAEAEQAEAEARQRAEVAKAKAEQTIKAAQIDSEREVKRAQSAAQASAEEAQAEALQRMEVAKTRAQQTIKAAQIESDRELRVAQAVAQQQVENESNNLRVRKAELDKVAIVKEQEAKTSGDKARVQYEQEVERARVILQQQRLQADVIEPARAKKEAAELEAQAAAASILESGQARLNVIKTMIETYQSAGTDAEKVFILNMLPEIITQLTSTVNKINIDKMSVIDQGGNSGNSFGRLVNQMPSAVLSLAETIENATGINIFNHLAGAKDAAQPVLKSNAETIVEAKEITNGAPIVD